MASLLFKWGFNMNTEKAIPVSFLKLENSLYSIEKVSEDGMDFEKKIINYHNKTLLEKLEEMNRTLIRESFDDWNSQIREVNKIRNSSSGEHKIPNDSNLYVVYRNMLLICVVIRFAPNEMRLRSGYTPDIIYNKICSILQSSNIDNDDADNFTIKFKAPIEPQPLVIGKSISGTGIYTPFHLSPHSFSDTRKICTGSYGSNFFTRDIKELEKRMNCINTSSLASGKIWDGEKYLSIEDYIDLIDPQTITIGGEEWSVQE